MSAFQKDYEDLSAAAARPVGDTLRQTCQREHNDAKTSRYITAFVDTLVQYCDRKGARGDAIQLAVDLLVQVCHRKEI